MPGNPALLEIIRTKGHLHVDTPLQLASGEWSQDFVDGKKALAHGPDLRLACEVLLDEVHAAGVEFDVVGGLTMGADHLSHGVALVGSVAWFTVRKEAKGRGTGRLIEGAELGPGVRALVVEDVVTTGSSALKAVRRGRRHRRDGRGGGDPRGPGRGRDRGLRSPRDPLRRPAALRRPRDPARGRRDHRRLTR